MKDKLLSIICGLGLTFSFCSAQSPYRPGVDPLTKLNEPKLAALPADSKQQIYRLMIAPTWGSRYCFRVDYSGTEAFLTFKRLSGQAGYGDGPIAESKRIKLTEKDWKEFQALVKASACESMSELDGFSGMDGDYWTIEVAKTGSYRQIERWCATQANDQGRGLADFVKLFQWAADKVGARKQVTNKGIDILDQLR